MRRRGAIASAFACVAIAFFFLSAGGMARAQTVPELTGPTPPMESIEAEPIARWVTDDVRLMRQYPEQPPVIPHSIEGYPEFS